MVKKLFRPASFVTLLTFSFQQLTFASPTFISPAFSAKGGSLPNSWPARLLSGGQAGASGGEAGGLNLIGLKLTWDELVTLVNTSHSVLVSIEDRHFVVVTGISVQGTASSGQEVTEPCTPDADRCFVTFMENGFQRTLSASDFKSKWFGIALVNESALNEVRSTMSDVRILKTHDLLKVKGAGWWKKLFKKIAKFFQEVVKAVVKVVKKVVSFVQKAINSTAGKIIGTIFLGPTGLQLFNFGLNSASYGLNGDFKGLFKYWGSNWIQIAALAVQLIPVVGQVLGTAFQALGAIVQGAGAFLGAAGGLIGSSLPVIGPIVGGIVQAGGAILSHAGGALIQYGSTLTQNSRNGFSKVSEWMKGGGTQGINPVTNYKSILPDGVKLISQDSLSHFITKIGEDALTQFAQSKIDQQLEKSKMNSFLKSILSTASSAGIGALSGAVADAVGSGLQSLIDTGKSILSTVQSGIQKIGQGISRAWDSTKSFFSSMINQIQGSRAPPINSPSLKGNTLYDPMTGKARITFSEGYAYAYDESGTPSQLTPNQSKYPFDLKPLTYDNVFRAEGDEGRFSYFEYDPARKEFSAFQAVDNLKTDFSQKTNSSENKIPLNQKFIDGFIQSGDHQGAIEFAARIVEGHYKPFEIKSLGYQSLKYDPANPDFRPGDFAITYPSGEIRFSDLTFKGSTSVQATIFHELIHQHQFFSSGSSTNVVTKYTREVEASVETLFYANRLSLAEEDIQDEINYLLFNLDNRRRLKQWLR